MIRTKPFCLAAAMAVGIASHASASTIEIQLNGINIGYDGTDIFDADPGLSDPDPLVSANFLHDGVLLGSVTTDVTLDTFIPTVEDIPVSGGVVLSDPGGTFDLDFGAAGSLALDLDEVTITYVDVAGLLQFTFGGSAATIAGQTLPFGIVLEDDPISIAFSTQITGGLTDDMTYITGFEASGTGLVSGVRVPEPATLSMVAILVAGVVARARKRLS